MSNDEEQRKLYALGAMEVSLAVAKSLSERFNANGSMVGYEIHLETDNDKDLVEQLGPEGTGRVIVVMKTKMHLNPNDVETQSFTDEVGKVTRSAIRKANESRDRKGSEFYRVSVEIVTEE